MINDENRREVAQKLRDAATECYNYGVLESDVLNILGVYETDSACLVSSDSVMDVADLIDRPTCKPKDRGIGYVDAVCDSFCCPNCGFEIDVHIGEEQHLTETAKYCPNCGAEVVE